MEKIIGIYKITSPSGRIYVGQSRDIKTRFNRYKKMHKSNSTQIRLWRSFKKYKPENHKFEIIERCEIENLNEKERYWQDKYRVLSKKGLNCILQETNILPKKCSKEYLSKRSGKNHWFFGKKHNQETKIKMSNSAKLKKVSEETKKKLSLIRKGSNNSFYGKKHSQETKKKQSESAKNRKIIPENENKRRINISKKLSKVVLKLDLKDNILQTYSSVTEAAKDNNTYVGSIVKAIQGIKVKKHKGFKWKYHE